MEIVYAANQPFSPNLTSLMFGVVLLVIGLASALAGLFVPRMRIGIMAILVVFCLVFGIGLTGGGLLSSRHRHPAADMNATLAPYVTTTPMRFNGPFDLPSTVTFIDPANPTSTVVCELTYDNDYTHVYFNSTTRACPFAKPGTPAKS